MAAVQQFKEGLGDLCDLVLGHPDTFRPIFVSDQQKLTFVIFRKLYDVKYSEQGSRRRALEGRTIYGWELFLQACFGKCSSSFSVVLI